MDGCCNQLLFFTCNNVISIFVGDTNWLIVATGVADCYYNVMDLPTGAAYRFRVACVNKAGQGPYSNLSEKIVLDSTGAQNFCGSHLFYPVDRQLFTKQNHGYL